MDQARGHHELTTTQQLADAAHQVCPYSNATRGITEGHRERRRRLAFLRTIGGRTKTQ